MDLYSGLIQRTTFLLMGCVWESTMMAKMWHKGGNQVLESIAGMWDKMHKANSPISVALSFSHCGRRSWPWSLCPRWRQRLGWRSHQHSGTGSWSSPHCCCQWSAAWTCSQSSGQPHPSGQAAAEGESHSLTPSRREGRGVRGDTTAQGELNTIIRLEARK